MFLVSILRISEIRWTHGYIFFNYNILLVIVRKNFQLLWFFIMEAQKVAENSRDMLIQLTVFKGIWIFFLLGLISFDEQL
jgi:hypothetical protein